MNPSRKNRQDEPRRFGGQPLVSPTLAGKTGIPLVCGSKFSLLLLKCFSKDDDTAKMSDRNSSTKCLNCGQEIPQEQCVLKCVFKYATGKGTSRTYKGYMCPQCNKPLKPNLKNVVEEELNYGLTAW